MASDKGHRLQRAGVGFQGVCLCSHHPLRADPLCTTVANLYPASLEVSNKILTPFENGKVIKGSVSQTMRFKVV